MKSITLPLIPSAPSDASEVPALFQTLGLEWQQTGVNNWPAEFPYTPKAEFRIARTDGAFLIHYRATEASVKAQYADDNGSVWTDSCMEFFLSPNPADGIYYNLECNCIGTVLLGVRGDNVQKAHAGVEVMGTIKRWASLGRTAFAERVGEETWEVALIVPFSAYWEHDVPALVAKAGGQGERVAMRANFYKCGDDLQQPHFLSWNPIKWEKPNFHLPEFFGEIII